MGSILKDAKKYYRMFHDRNGVFDRAMAASAFEGMGQAELRTVVVSKVYDIMMRSRRSTEAVRLYISTPMTVGDAARKMGRNASTVKSELYYFSQCVGEYLMYGDDSLIRACLMEGELDGSRIKGQLTELAESLRKRQARGKSIIDRRSLLVNIPKTAECRETGDEEWESFLELVKPYIVAERARAQKKINAHPSCGYFNYIMGRDAVLNERDRARRDSVLSLCGDGVLKKAGEREEKADILLGEDSEEDYYIDI